jgi:hypothetical protein
MTARIAAGIAEATATIAAPPTLPPFTLAPPPSALSKAAAKPCSMDSVLDTITTATAPA